MKLLPSLASSDLTDIRNTVQLLEKLGCEALHLDIEDGHFGANITFGERMLRDVRKITTLPFNVHLMVTNPEQWIDLLCDLGVEEIVFHIEAAEHPFRLIQDIRSKSRGQCRAGLALNPKTTPSALRYFADSVESVLIMTTDESRTDNHFITTMYEKIQKCARLGIGRVIVDGDISEPNIARVRMCDATHAVVGRSLFHDGQIEANYINLVNSLS